MRRIILTDRFKQHLDPEFYEEFADTEVITAYSNEDAVKIHRGKKADLIITELYGAGMNAMQLCSLLREDVGMREVSVIVYSRDNEVERGEAMRCRANAVMALPVSRERLRETIRRFLNVPPRRSLRGTFTARRATAPGGTVDCLTENISVTGMLIATVADLRRGERMQGTLAFPDRPSLAAQVEVVRTGDERLPFGFQQYGVRFSRLDLPSLRVIERIVQQQA